MKSRKIEKNTEKLRKIRKKLRKKKAQKSVKRKKSLKIEVKMKTMTIFECQQRAQRDERKDVFYIVDASQHRLKCKWFDPFLGPFNIEGIKGFITVKVFAEMYPVIKDRIEVVDDVSIVKKKAK